MANTVINLPAEIWKPVVGFEGFYEVSSLGRVRSLDRTTTTRGNKIKPYKRSWKGRILSHSFIEGYPSVILYKESEPHTLRIHRGVLSAFLRLPKSGEVCMHLDHCRSNNHLTNLKWGTQRENMQQSVDDGKLCKGEDKPFAKLSNTDVQEIKSLLRDGSRLTHREIGKRYGVTVGVISNINTGRAWKHIN